MIKITVHAVGFPSDRRLVTCGIQGEAHSVQRLLYNILDLSLCIWLRFADLFMRLATYGSAFNHLLDDSPLGTGEISSSALTATAFHSVGPGEKGAMRDSGALQEVEKGLLLLIASDTPGLQVSANFLHLCCLIF